MASPTDQIPLLRLLLASSGRHDTLQRDSSTKSCRRAAGFLPAASLAVVHANPPKWELQAASGLGDRTVPSELVADALDRDAVIAGGEWVVAPAGRGLRARRPAASLIMRR